MIMLRAGESVDEYRRTARAGRTWRVPAATAVALLLLNVLTVRPATAAVPVRVDSAAISAGAAAASAGAAATPAGAAAAPVRIGVFRVADPQVINGYARIVYYLRNVPRGAGAQLEVSPAGSGRWQLIGNVPGPNEVGTSALFRTPPIGVFSTRLVVRIGSRVLAVSPSRSFRVYAALPAESVYRSIGQNSTVKTATIGSAYLRYIDYTGFASNTMSVDHSTCRSVTVSGGNSGTRHSANVRVSQQGTAPTLLTIQPQAISSARVPLSGLALTITLEPSDDYLYFYAYFSCYTSTGQ
ncbi:hypothetical protein ABIB25_003935 [Nakamurella sp. UYEF19]|uniref:hypothetical protein n=1 Tax=Nakamurella sp. UYEF19 TaxID=1756392 RepID=UPI003393AC80